MTLPATDEAAQWFPVRLETPSERDIALRNVFIENRKAISRLGQATGRWLRR
jgi:hypothetical protein